MSTDAAPIFDAALALPQSLRADLAAKLLESLDPSIDDFCYDDPNFEDELARRRQELLDGTVKGIPAEESINAIRKSIEERRRG